MVGVIIVDWVVVELMVDGMVGVIIVDWVVVELMVDRWWG